MSKNRLFDTPLLPSVRLLCIQSVDRLLMNAPSNPESAKRTERVQNNSTVVLKKRSRFGTLPRKEYKKIGQKASDVLVSSELPRKPYNQANLFMQLRRFSSLMISMISYTACSSRHFFTQVWLSAKVIK